MDIEKDLKHFISKTDLFISLTTNYPSHQCLVAPSTLSISGDYAQLVKILQLLIKNQNDFIKEDKE